jgi:hypothetical protein
MAIGEMKSHPLLRARSRWKTSYPETGPYYTLFVC